jgi:D-alanine transaminase
VADALPICYLNGAYPALSEARISPLDRGFLFADAVYEVMPVYGGRPFRFEAHCERLTRSLREIHMDDPHSRAEWRAIIAGLIERNGGGDLSIYWQVTRGADRARNPAPLPQLPRTVFAFCAPLAAIAPEVLERGIECVTATDTRWARCDIKTVALLANVLLREQAAQAGAAETILLRDGELTEASSAAVHVLIEGTLYTPPRSARLLPGTTRSVVEELATRIGLPWRAERVTEPALRAAQEIWISSALREVIPVTRLDGAVVGAGRPGSVWRGVIEELQRYKQELHGQPW